MSMRSNLKTAFLRRGQHMFMKKMFKGFIIKMEVVLILFLRECFQQRMLFTLILFYLVPDLFVVIVASENKHLL